jgi:hypothetical protein
MPEQGAYQVLPYQQKGAGRFRRSAQLFDDDVFADPTRRVNNKSSEKQNTLPMGL